MLEITQALIDRIKEQNKNWWIDIRTGEPLTRNVGEMLALVHSELSEAFEGALTVQKDDKLKHRDMFDVEVIDAVIRVCDIAGGLNLDIVTHMHAAPLGMLKHASRYYGLLMLHKTVSDALEADRKNTGEPAMHLGWFLAQSAVFLDKQMVDEAAQILEEKLAYNRARVDHSIAARLEANGKRY